VEEEQLKEAVRNIRTWKKNGERAPHKPLLILYALGRVAREEPREMLYEDVKEHLRKLLVDFGPYRQTHSPSYPFVRLCNDGIWEIKGIESLNTKKDWTDRELIENLTRGSFTEEVHGLLAGKQELLSEVAQIVLKDNFPGTLHEDILAQVGLDLELTGTSTVPEGIIARSPDFRHRVLKAYEYRCAVCGFNVRLGDALVAVEAAHIKWHQAGGPEHEQNGIALCSLHHKLFDRGVFTLDKKMVFQVAENAHGTHGMEEWLLRYHGQQVRSPVRPVYYPESEFINWHVKEVFKGPARWVS